MKEKKLRRIFREELDKKYKEFWNELCDLPFFDRLFACWDIIRQYRWK